MEVGPRATPTSAAVAVTIGPSRGRYRGEPTARRYRVEMVDVSRPSTVTVDGRRLRRTSLGSARVGWSYAASATVLVTTPTLAITGSATVVAAHCRGVDRPEPD